MYYIVPQEMSLFEALSKLSPESSTNTLRDWLKEGRILVDGYIIKGRDFTVREGQKISLGPKLKFIKEGIRVYFEDKHLIVVEKPVGLLSVATHFEKEDTLHHMLKRHYRGKQVYVVHRLDQETSGVMLFALSQQASDALKMQFEKHKIERAYTAIVEGEIEQDSGTWKSYLCEDANYYVYSTPDANRGRLAVTHFELLGATKKNSSLKLTLETGRKNQIRVHCYDAGHPIIGDVKYHAKTNPIKRLGLHAHLLAFTHPITKQALRFESTLPESFQGYLCTK